MKTFIDRTIKPVLIVGGLGTAAAGVDAFMPRFAVENIQRMEFIPEYTIFVQHWGIMVCLMGVFMVAAAFVQSWRTPVVLFGMLEKAFMVFLVASNRSEDFSGGFMLPGLMDAFITVWSILYLLARPRSQPTPTSHG